LDSKSGARRERRKRRKRIKRRIKKWSEALISPFSLSYFFLRIGRFEEEIWRGQGTNQSIETTTKVPSFLNCSKSLV
jgi:hypothetical protein